MTDSDTLCLEAFPAWLRSLREDASGLAALVADAGAPESLRRPLASALNYLFKSLDLVPDGIEDLGFLDDAFILRVAASQADPGGAPELVQRLAGDAALVAEFLGEHYPKLEQYVRALGTGSIRGRNVDQIVGDAAVAAAFENEVKGWASSFVVPSFTRDAKNLVKLKSFIGAKLAL
jgi:uncharacterized membrane protein YkvA (DUF1232 family)